MGMNACVCVCAHMMNCLPPPLIDYLETESIIEPELVFFSYADWPADS